MKLLRSPGSRELQQEDFSPLSNLIRSVYLLAFLGLASCAGRLAEKHQANVALETITLATRDQMRAELQGSVLDITVQTERRDAVVAIPGAATAAHGSPPLSDEERVRISGYLRKIGLENTTSESPSPVVTTGEIVKALLYGKNGEQGKYEGTFGDNVRVRIARSNARGDQEVGIYYFHHNHVVSPGKKIPSPKDPENDLPPDAKVTKRNPDESIQRIQIGDSILNEYEAVTVSDNAVFSFVGSDGREKAQLNPGVKFYQGPMVDRGRYQYPGRRAYMGAKAGMILTDRTGNPLNAGPRGLSRNDLNYDRMPQGNDRREVLAGRVPRLEWKDNQFYRLTGDSPRDGLKADELVYVKDPTKNTVTIVLGNGKEVTGVPKSFLEGPEPADSPTVKQYKRTRFTTLHDQLAFSGFDVSDFPSIPIERVSENTAVTPAPHQAIQMAIGERTVELGQTDAAGKLHVQLAQVLSCADISQSEDGTIAIQTSSASTQLPAEQLAMALMSADEIAAYRDHVIAEGVGRTLGPSLRYLARYPQGCMAGRVARHVQTKAGGLYQRKMAAGEQISLPPEICEGPSELSPDEEFYVGESAEGTRLASSDGRCEGEIDGLLRGSNARVLECFGGEEENAALEKLRNWETLLKTDSEFRYAYIASGPLTEPFLMTIHNFLQRHPTSCHREEVQRLLAAYLEKENYRYVERERIEFSGSVDGTQPGGVFGKGRYLVKKVHQNSHANIAQASLGDVFGSRQQMWRITSLDGSTAGYTSNLQLFGTDEEDPTMFRQALRAFGTTTAMGVIATHGFLEATIGPLEIPTPEEEEKFRLKKQERQLQGQQRALEEARRTQRKVKRWGQCRENCEANFQFCKACSEGKPFLCGGLLPRSNFSKCVEARDQDCLPRCGYLTSN